MMVAGGWDAQMQPLSHGERLWKTACERIEKEVEERVARLTRERDAAIAQLAAEREARRREGLEAAAKHIKNACVAADWLAADIRALRDTPAAPETGKTEGENDA